MSAPTIKEQADAIEIAAVNLRGHVDNLSMIVEKGKRPQHDLDLFCKRLPLIEQAAKTLKFLQKYESELKALIERDKAA